MKRWLVPAAVGIFALGSAVGAMADSASKQINVQYNNIKIKVDGKTIDTGNSEPFTVVDEGRIYVPARYLAEALGAKVGWDGSSSTVLVFSPNDIETHTENGVTTYTSPYYGMSLKLPEGGKLTRPTNEYFSVDSPNVIYGLIRWHKSSVIHVVAYAKQFETTHERTQGFQFSDVQAVQVPGAVAAGDFSGTANIGGIPLRMKVRAIIGQRDVWILYAIFADSTSSQYSPTADQAFSSLTLAAN